MSDESIKRVREKLKKIRTKVTRSLMDPEQVKIIDRIADEEDVEKDDFSDIRFDGPEMMPFEEED